jgi:elongator complex protein 3
MIVDMPEERDYHIRLLQLLSGGEIKDKLDLQRAKIRLCREMGLARVPPNSETLGQASPEQRDLVLSLLRRKPVRTLSGVAVVAVMTSPAPCPHGKCSYCPGGVDNGSPQSYTGKEPAARRAAAHDFDPYRQVVSRIGALEAIGHGTGKIDLIIMGGTFTSRPTDYQQGFVKACFDAMNEEGSGSLEEAQALNETAPHRCVGMTVETRPDCFDRARAEQSLRLGATRVELGVQILDDAILRSVNRGHGIEEVAVATKAAKDLGLKVCYHLMPGLPGSDPAKDLASFSRVFQDERFRPDMLKLYPTLVVKGTALYDMWKRGEYEPYTVDEAARVIADMKAEVPRWVRIQRIQRDIPAPLIEAGVRKGDLRELARAVMAERGTRCQCVRCREVGLSGVRLEEGDEPTIRAETYRASGGKEHFISLGVVEKDALVGYARLRTNGGGRAHLRELKVFGRMAAIGHGQGEWQHRGFGKELVACAEAAAAREGCAELAVTSGVGVRRYYAGLGYERAGVYMLKRL